jgi:CDGSH-type Zn-finger protein
MKAQTAIKKADEPKKCGCGKTQNSEGNCDGSHANK